MRAVFLTKIKIITWGTVLLWATTGSFAQTGGAVEWKDTKLSVRFDDTTISQVLTSIANRTGMKLTIDPSVSSYKVSVSFKDMSLPDGILKVLDGSAIDYIVVGDSRSPRLVSQVMLLGFTPKIPPSSAAAGFSQQQSQQIDAAPGGASSMFPGRQQPGPARPGDRGRFLPFPETNDGGNTEQPGQQAVPVNPFNPNPAGNTNNPATNQPNSDDRTTRRRPPTWPPQSQ